MTLARRQLFQSAAMTALGHALGACRRSSSTVSPASADGVQAALKPDPKGILDLPEGFSYRIVQRSGARMSDGYRVPGRPDAMGCFPGVDGSIVLMRNHEMRPGDSNPTPYFDGQSPPPEAYDPAGTGGVTRIVLDADSLEVRRSNLVLAGTFWNCAGGLSPWGWLSCEETVDDPKHGYVFLCAADVDRVQSARRLPGYGRMRHEAAAVDPQSHIAYLTEDRPDGCFYRFVPRDPARPFDGVLQALAIQDQPGFATAGLKPGQRLPVAWVDVPNPDSPEDTVRSECVALGAARVCRGEGLWLGRNTAYFAATAGGPSSRGQIFRLSLTDAQTLEVIADGADGDVLDMPDNICVSPHGHIYAAEDGSGENFVRRIGSDGKVRPFARNAISHSEFAGPCFSPDGRSMFVNIQDDGLTLAIQGPFAQPLKGEPISAVPFGLKPTGFAGGLSVIALAALCHVRTRTDGR